MQMKKKLVAVSEINEKHRQQNFEIQRAAAQAQVEGSDAKTDVFARIKTAPIMAAPVLKSEVKEEKKEGEKKEEEKKTGEEKPPEKKKKQIIPVEDIGTKLKKAHDFDLTIDDVPTQQLSHHHQHHQMSR